MRIAVFALLAAVFGLECRALGDVVGAKVPEWTVTEWIHSDPLTLASLHGKVLVVRWWTGPDCPYCAESAPGLNDLWKKYRNQGLVVIGMYHHKAATPLTREHVEAEAKRLGLEFPVGIDRDWKTLHAWWLDREPGAAWTSVTFVLGRDGTVRHVHPGGALVEGKADYAALERAVQDALKN